MRIVQTLGSATRGGAERFFVRLVKAFAARGLAQLAITKRNAWAAGQLEKVGIEPGRLWLAGSWDLISRVRYRHMLGAFSADIAINWMPNAVCACPPGHWLRVARLGRTYAAAAFRGYDHLIASSPRIMAHMTAQGWPEGRISYIPSFVPEIKAEPVRRSSLNTPEDAPLILWLGAMTEQKAPDLMLRALAETPDAYLWMAGRGRHERKVKQLCAELGLSARTRFLGWRDDIHALLKAADIFVRCAGDEGLGNILDAWAHGLPLVSTRCADTEGLIAHGETGLIVPRGDASALAEAIKTLIGNRDLAGRLGAAGNARFQVEFSEEPVVAMYLDLCNRLKADAPSRARREKLAGKTTVLAAQPGP